MYKRTFVATAVAASMAAVSFPAVAQQQGGLVNVNVGDVSVELQDVISENNINVQIPANLVVQVPIGIAANVCDINAAVLAQQDVEEGDTACSATNETATRTELRTLARSLQRQ